MAEYDERYVTLEQVKRELPFDADDFELLDANAFDVLLKGDANTEGLLERESRRLEEWADTKWTTETVTESLSRPEHVDSDELPLPYLPIDSVDSVETEDEGTLTETDDYHVLETHLKIESDSETIQSWPTAFQEIDVTWDYGFDSVPPAVTGALVRLVRNAIDQIEMDGLAQEQLVGGGMWNYRTPNEIRAEVIREIRPHAAPSYYGGAVMV